MKSPRAALRTAALAAALLAESNAFASRASAELPERIGRDAARLVDAALASDQAMRRLTTLCDSIGARLSGSQGLERAVAWAERVMREDGLERVEAMPVLVPHWVRGAESATLVEPRRENLAMLGLGGSVGTPPEGITAPVVVVSSFEDFAALSDAAVRGKIVLWNVPFTTYGETVAYRANGGIAASRRGAVASLVRTVGRRSLRSPHTGAQSPDSAGVAPIPAAALSVEDAMLLARLAESGQVPVVSLRMEAKTLPDALSHNVLGELTGRELPHEVVAIGGHLDSWDVGQGAHDDGGGCVIAMEAVRLMKELGLRPRRTVRVVLWTNEENGTRGADEYRRVTRERGEAHAAAIESDGGVEDPVGFGITIRREGTRKGSDEVRQRAALRFLREISLGLAGAGADSIRAGGGGADIDPLMGDGVPGLALVNTMDLYWDIHHSHADTIDKVDPMALRKNVAAMAWMAYVLAEIPERL